MIEMELLHNQSLIGVTLRLPKTKILFIYHTHAILISEPFMMESEVFQKMNVLYVEKADTFDTLLQRPLLKYQVRNELDIQIGMRALDALERLQT